MLPPSSDSPRSSINDSLGGGELRTGAWRASAETLCPQSVVSNNVCFNLLSVLLEGCLVGHAERTVEVVAGDCRSLKSLGDLLVRAGYDARLFSSAEEFLAGPA